MGDEYVANGSFAFHSQMWENTHQTDIRPHIEWGVPEEVPLRIGISGAHGVGKNKLAKKLAVNLEIPIISHVPRTVKNLGLELNRGGDIFTQVAVWLGQINEQVELFEFVSDRTLIDYLAYSRIMLDSHGSEIDEYLITALCNLTYSLFNSQYTIVFYIPPDNSYIKNNGFRSRDRGYQAEVDELIRYYLSCFNVDYFPLQGSEINKYKLAMDYLEDSGLLEKEE